MSDFCLDDVPRGNTCPGVNKLIIQHLLSLPETEAGRRLLDNPCGNGEFLDAVKAAIPSIRTFGADIAIPAVTFDHDFIQADLSGKNALDLETTFDVVTCISGVMEFDNTLSFFEQIHRLIARNGELIVTNDNLLSVRDRLLYFLFGRFGQYKHTWKADEPTWKVLTISNLIRILSDAGFVVADLKYVPPHSAEWLWLPIAAAIYGIELIAGYHREDNGINIQPFVSLLSRHYVLFCRPRTPS